MAPSPSGFLHPREQVEASPRISDTRLPLDQTNLISMVEIFPKCVCLHIRSWKSVEAIRDSGNRVEGVDQSPSTELLGPPPLAGCTWPILGGYTMRTFGRAYRNQGPGEDSSRRHAAKAEKVSMRRQHGRKPCGESRGMKHMGFAKDGPCSRAIRAKTAGQKPCREGHGFHQEPDLTGGRPSRPSRLPGVSPLIGPGYLAH
uniref:Uncharacterized protein n=1 Tax=Oryza sativa subsp. japonica TaxID=39947 RepID=Q33B85_ORYSJ|nr:hypothetical protein LOC_Os10g04260 [Oryza sativa Japonica Group]